MIETLNQLDHSLMLWMNYDGGACLDTFWYFLSNKYTWVPLYLALLGYMGYDASRRGGWRQFLVLIGITALIILLADQLASGLIKPWVQRPRPSHQEGIMEQLHYVNGYLGGAYGFVSSHAANTVALAYWVSHLYPRRSVILGMTLFVVLNCYSRIYLGVHYPGDILCGALIGLLAGVVGVKVYDKIMKDFKIFGF